jgi:hypothetical protein
MSVLKAVREKCLDCCCGMIVEVRECTVTTCALHPYRMGKNPFRQKRVLSDEQREALASRLAAARGAKA